MGYEGDMGYGANFPAYQHDIAENAWNLRDYTRYGIRERWVR